VVVVEVMTRLEEVVEEELLMKPGVGEEVG
jgi:hypothetical protein